MTPIEIKAFNDEFLKVLKTTDLTESTKAATTYVRSLIHRPPDPAREAFIKAMHALANSEKSHEPTCIP